MWLRQFRKVSNIFSPRPETPQTLSLISVSAYPFQTMYAIAGITVGNPWREPRVGRSGVVVLSLLLALLSLLLSHYMCVPVGHSVSGTHSITVTQGSLDKVVNVRHPIEPSKEIAASEPPKRCGQGCGSVAVGS
jgi:hypothetical protein